MGGSSTKTTSTQELPQWAEDAFREQMDRASDIAQQGYVPYMGADTAAFSPQQVQAMQQSSDWSNTFMNPGGQRLDVAASLPPAQRFNDGTTGYSSFPGYLEQMAHLKHTYPGQYNYIKQFAIDPMTGGEFKPDPGPEGSGNEWWRNLFGGGGGEEGEDWEWRSDGRNGGRWKWINGIKYPANRYKHYFDGAPEAGATSERDAYAQLYGQWYEDQGGQTFDEWLEANPPGETAPSGPTSWDDFWNSWRD